MSHIIIGTAGHIDHGKTALVKALTGVDTDRLKEEKARGLTIDLGFAHLGEKATIIDVPGHEKFIRNMVAGVSTIDLVLFVVAADDGVMPQTREHLDILKILQVRNGIIVITKKDLVDDDWLELVRDDIRKLTHGSFLQNAKIIAASSTNGDGISEIKTELEDFLNKSEAKRQQGLFWMPIDRAFTMKGFGTVVTGSVLSGQVNGGERLELLPQGMNVRIRGIQSHDLSVETVSSGDRAAINLQAVEKQQVHRGNVLASANYFTSARRFDAKLQLLESAPRALKTRTRVRVHFGTTEVMARVILFSTPQIEPGAGGFVQLHLEHPAVARRLDPFVIRQYSPTITIGGGVILDANASPHKASDPTITSKLQALEKENPTEILENKLLSEKYGLLTIEQLCAEIATPRESMEKLLQELQKQEKIILAKKSGKDAVIHNNNFAAAKNLVIEIIGDFHKNHPAKLGQRKAEFRNQLKSKMDPELLDTVVAALQKAGELRESAGLLALTAHKITFTPTQEKLRQEIDRLLFEEGFVTSSDAQLAQKLNGSLKSVQEVLTLQVGLGEVIRVEDNIYFHPGRVQEAREKVVEYLKKNAELTVSQFKGLLGNTSRKYALPLLLYFDGLGVTERVGGVRILGSQA